MAYKIFLRTGSWYKATAAYLSSDIDITDLMIDENGNFIADSFLSRPTPIGDEGGGDGGGAEATTASNGLALQGVNVKMGGPLVEETTIDTGANTLVLTSSVNRPLSVSGPNIPLDVFTFSNTAVATFGAANNTDNTTLTGIRLTRYPSSNGPSAVGLGVSIDFELMDAIGLVLGGSIVTRVTAKAPLLTTMEFKTRNASGAGTRVAITDKGFLQLVQPTPNYADNAAAIAGGLAVGTIYRTGGALQIVI